MALVNLLWVGLGAFLLSLAWRFALEAAGAARASGSNRAATRRPARTSASGCSMSRPSTGRCCWPLALAAVIFPWLVSTYQVNIMVLALIYVVLGLGLNITVGLAGLLDLGYVAFFAVGAYTYGILNHIFGLGFWTCLPLGGLVGWPVRHSARFSDPAPARRLPGDRHPRFRFHRQDRHRELGGS